MSLNYWQMEKWDEKPCWDVPGSNLMIALFNVKDFHGSKWVSQVLRKNDTTPAAGGGGTSGEAIFRVTGKDPVSVVEEFIGKLSRMQRIWLGTIELVSAENPPVLNTTRYWEIPRPSLDFDRNALGALNRIDWLSTPIPAGGRGRGTALSRRASAGPPAFRMVHCSGEGSSWYGQFHMGEEVLFSGPAELVRKNAVERMSAVWARAGMLIERLQHQAYLMMLDDSSPDGTITNTK